MILPFRGAVAEEAVLTVELQTVSDQSPDDFKSTLHRQVSYHTLAYRRWFISNLLLVPLLGNGGEGNE